MDILKYPSSKFFSSFFLAKLDFLAPIVSEARMSQSISMYHLYLIFSYSQGPILLLQISSMFECFERNRIRVIIGIENLGKYSHFYIVPGIEFFWKSWGVEINSQRESRRTYADGNLESSLSARCIEKKHYTHARTYTHTQREKGMGISMNEALELTWKFDYSLPHSWGLDDSHDNENGNGKGLPRGCKSLMHIKRYRLIFESYSKQYYYFK